MKRNIFITAILLLSIAISGICSAQQKKSDFVIGDKISFESKVFNERKTIVVIPPYNYKDRPDEKFPVVYVLDPGNNLFATFGIVNYYSDMLKIMPCMIVVGIVSGDREKDYLPTPSKEQPTGGGADKFLRFINSELVTLIDSAYPSNSERCIIGHSAGGLFALYALENQPDLFNSFICIDPSLWYDDQSCIKKMSEFLKNNKNIKKSIFISLSNEKKMGVFPFIEELETYAPEGLKWDYIHYKNETHNSLGFKSICAALAAWNLLKAIANIQNGQKVLIYGASGSIGLAAVQIAKIFGAEVTGVCSSSNLEIVKSLGADNVIDKAVEDFTKNGLKYDVIIDVSGKPLSFRYKNSLTKRGFYLTIYPTISTLFQTFWTSMITGKKVVFSATAFKPVSVRLAFLKELLKLFTEGKLKTIIDQSFHLDQMVEAHRYIEKGLERGNVVVNI